jgi:glycosyltransferase involved in cell wall biosynthesis
MPVHNAAPYLDEAVGSILNQTYRDFEFVILDDGSTDGSAEKLRDWANRDSRIRLHRQERNSGPAESSNLVVQHAGGSLIARMDADDVSYPDRLQQQIDLLNRRPDVGLVGTLCDVIDKDGHAVRSRDLWRLTRRSWFAPFPHGSIMYRRDLFELAGGYRDQCVYWEDHTFDVARQCCAARR